MSRYLVVCLFVAINFRKSGLDKDTNQYVRSKHRYTRLFQGIGNLTGRPSSLPACLRYLYIYLQTSNRQLRDVLSVDIADQRVGNAMMGMVSLFSFIRCHRSLQEVRLRFRTLEGEKYNFHWLVADPTTGMGSTVIGSELVLLPFLDLDH